MADADTGRTLEIERKYDVPDGFALPDLTAVATIGSAHTYTLRAEYHDTEDLHLARRNVTLRRREGGTDAGWHLKVPTAKDTRIELHVPLSSGRNPPDEVRVLVLAHTRGDVLQPVATLTTTRILSPLLDADGRLLAEIADDTVHAERPGGGATSWREIEVELIHGGHGLLKAVGKLLRAAGAERARRPSKLARVLGDDIPAPIRPAGHTGTIGAAVVAYLVRQVEAVLGNDPLARRAEFDAVHRMRVAVRRVRSTLKAYRPILDRTYTEALRAELAWLAAELGTVRDLEVLRMRCTARLATFDQHMRRPEKWLDDLARSETEAYVGLNNTLSGRRYLDVLDGLDALIALPPFTDLAERDAHRELTRLTSRAWAKLATAYEAADTPETRHEARKLAKQARYAAEAARPVRGEPAARMAGHAEQMQEALGGFQDGQLAMARLKVAAEACADPAEAFTLGVLYGMERRDAYASLDTIAETWARAARDV